MAKKLTPQEQDRQATLAAQGQPVESTAPAGSSLMRLWSLAGLLAALAFVGGFFGGQWYERALHGGDAELIGLLGAQLVDASGGTLFDQVVTGGPSYVAGIQNGDRFVALDGMAVNSAQDALKQLRRYSVGQVVQITLERSHRFMQVSLVIGGAIVVPPTPFPVTPVPYFPPPQQYQEAHLGILYRMVQPDDPFSVSQGALIVSFLDSGTPAEAAGLLPGDIITQVSNQTITESYTLTDALSRYGAGQQVQLRINRAGDDFTVTATLGG
jgi:S1-C subfamily serine protease